MTDVYQVDPKALIDKVAEELKKNNSIVAPAWAPFVKTGTNKTQPPTDLDWWHTRVAAILRTVATRGPIGTNKLKVKYGGKKRRGHKKPEFRTGSGKIARVALQQLDKAGFIVLATVGSHKGRILTPAGKSLLDKCAGGIE
jgi:small subunit ribosomal protein S19e